MSDRFGKSGLSSCSTWNLFAENTVFEETDISVEKLGKRAETTRLHLEDTSKYGFCPSRSNLDLTSCKQCQKLVAVSSMLKHYELKHPKYLSTIKPLPPKRHTPGSLPLTNTATISYLKSRTNKLNANEKIRIEEINPNEKNVKIEEVPLTIPQFNSSISKLKLPKINLKKSVCETKNKLASPVTSPCVQAKPVHKKISHLKEYDADRHCGVWIPEHDKNCTRSLTCKTHTLSLRRQVPGRSKHFDVLLAEHRVRVALKSQDNSPPGKTPVSSLGGRLAFPTLTQSTGNERECNLKSPKPHRSPSFSKRFDAFLSPDTIGSSNLPTIPYHPRPLRLNTFGGRKTSCSCRVFSRRTDHTRHALVSMMEQFNSSTSSKLSIKDPSRLVQENLSATVNDPLQNGIVYKHKTKPRTSGLKRQVSYNEMQSGIIADSLSYAASAKRRHSSDIDTFAARQSNNFTKPSTYLNQKPASVKYFHKPEHVPSRRPKSANAYIGNNTSMSASLENYLTGKLTAAPNVTITQGMLVSLPTAVLQSNSGVYSIASQLNELIYQSKQQISSSPTSAPVLKQTIADANFQQNGLTQPKTKYLLNDVPPNVTLPLTSTNPVNLHSVSWSKPPLKQRLLEADESQLLQQLIVQQVEQNRVSSSPSLSLVTHTLQQSNVSKPSFLSASTNSTQLLKHFQKPNQQLQQQFAHPGFSQQQILPKLPTVSQNVAQLAQYTQSNVQFIAKGSATTTLKQPGAT